MASERCLAFSSRPSSNISLIASKARLYSTARITPIPRRPIPVALLRAGLLASPRKSIEEVDRVPSNVPEWRIFPG